MRAMEMIDRTTLRCRAFADRRACDP